jgi:hypothetical protein
LSDVWGGARAGAGLGPFARRCAVAAAFALGAPTCRPRAERAAPAPVASPRGAPSAEGAAGPGAWSPPALGPPLAPVDVPAFRALGHAGGRYDVRLWSSDPAAYRAGGAPAAGFVVCADHREGPGPGPPDLVTCMRREAGPGAGAWLYGVMERGGGPWLRVGALDDCAGCHHSAPRGGLYGPPPEGGRGGPPGGGAGGPSGANR